MKFEVIVATEIEKSAGRKKIRFKVREQKKMANNTSLSM